MIDHSCRTPAFPTVHVLRSAFTFSESDLGILQKDTISSSGISRTFTVEKENRHLITMYWKWIRKTLPRRTVVSRIDRDYPDWRSFRIWIERIVVRPDLFGVPVQARVFARPSKHVSNVLRCQKRWTY